MICSSTIMLYTLDYELTTGFLSHSQCPSSATSMEISSLPKFIAVNDVRCFFLIVLHTLFNFASFTCLLRRKGNFFGRHGGVH